MLTDFFLLFNTNETDVENTKNVIRLEFYYTYLGHFEYIIMTIEKLAFFHCNYDLR